MRLKDYARNDQQFYRWLQDVDRYISSKLGVTLLDLADWAWRDAYESGQPAEDAAAEFLEGEGYDIDDNLQD